MCGLCKTYLQMCHFCRWKLWSRRHQKSEPCKSGSVQARGELRALALAQAAERLAGRDLAALQNLGGLHTPDLGESQHHVEDLRGLQVRRRVEQQRTNRHPAGLELALELRAKRTNLVRPAERVHALIQAALGCHPAGLNPRAKGTLLKRNANALIAVASQPLALATTVTTAA